MIISLTTIPDRIEHIKPCLDALVLQGLPVYLWAVEKIDRSDTVMKDIPTWLKLMDTVTVNVVPDFGPMTKLLPALYLDTKIIITADDDQLYTGGWVREIVKKSKQYPQAVLGYRGRILKENKYSTTLLIKHTRISKAIKVDILTGVCGILYQRSFFNPDIFDLVGSWRSNDDLLLASYFKTKKIDQYVIPGTCKIKPTRVQHNTPLYLVNRKNKDKKNNLGVQKLNLWR